MPSITTQPDKPLAVRIEKLVFGGQGLAHEGSMAVFVRGALPGETVLIQPGRPRKGYLEGRLFEILEPSSDRVQAPCPVYGRCGGCQLQHATNEAQRALKREILVETLARVGGVTDVDVPPLGASPESYAYRSRARFAVLHSGSGGASLAYYEEGSQALVPISSCLLLAEPLNQTVGALNRLLSAGEARILNLQEIRVACSSSTGDVVLLYTAERTTSRKVQDWLARVRSELPALKGQVLLAGRGRERRRWVEGDPVLTEIVAGLSFRISGRSFTQANWQFNEKLVESVKDWALAEMGVSRLRILELYAGIGNFGLPLARAGGLVTLVEGNPAALADARYTARVNHVGGSRFRQGPVEAALAECAPGEYDLVLMDPPRTGVSREAMEHLHRLKPNRLLYLSCDPPTLARDLHALREAGYRITRLQGYDLFPQTMHIETLVELQVA